MCWCPRELRVTHPVDRIIAVIEMIQPYLSLVALPDISLCDPLIVVDKGTLDNEMQLF
jgi:hypothetical protein